MPWQIIIFARMVVGHIVAPFLFKKMADISSSLRRLVWWQFFFCLCFSFIYALFSGITLKPMLWMVAGIGFFNAFGAYCQWQAVKISLSKTSLFTQPDDIIAIFLGYVALNEVKFLNTGLFFGMILCFGAAALLLSGGANLRLMKYIAIYSVIWGVATFLGRYFALKGISFSEFLVSWYGGTLIGISCILCFFKGEGLSIRLPKKEMLGIGIFSILVWSSLLLCYWGANLAPITVFQPIILVSEAVFPTVIGLLIFKESKALRVKAVSFRGKIRIIPIEKIAFGLGIAGIITIGISYR